VNRHFGDNSSDSCSRVLIAVVRKNSVIALMILSWTDASARSCAVVGAVRVSPSLCQIIAPWSIRGAATAGKRRLMYLYSGPHMLLAIPAIASAYFVPLSVMCSRWERNFVGLIILILLKCSIRLMYIRI
jgi:hypothetical protein